MNLGSIFKRVFWIAYLAVLHGITIFFIGEKVMLSLRQSGDTAVQTVSESGQNRDVPSPISPLSQSPPAFLQATPDAQNVNRNLLTIPSEAAPTALIIPVAGVKPDQLTDTFTQARSGGRVHDAIDIMAPLGTSVMAAADGTILKFHDSVPGGITIYELSADKRFVYYYAHLQRRADELHEGDVVKQGIKIGFVGDTGNAGAGNYHLHFAIWSVDDPKNFWNGLKLNPYLLLRYGTSPR